MSERAATRDDLRQLAGNALRLDSIDLATLTSGFLLREESGDSEATWILDAILARMVVVMAPDGRTGRLRQRGLT
jgi:hypothetical protein